jgi:hypothetical protein
MILKLLSNALSTSVTQRNIIFLEELKAISYSTIFLPFVDPECALSCLQELITYPCPHSDECRPHRHTIFPEDPSPIYAYVSDWPFHVRSSSVSTASINYARTA